MTDIFKSADWAREALARRDAHDGESSLAEVSVGRVPEGCEILGLGMDDIGIFCAVRYRNGDEGRVRL